MVEKPSECYLEVRIDKLAEEIKKIQEILTSLTLSDTPERLNIENVSVNEINFNLQTLNINELSGALNIGITNGVKLTSNRKEQPSKVNRAETIQSAVTPPKDQQKKVSVAANKKISRPECHISFGR